MRERKMGWEGVGVDGEEDSSVEQQQQFTRKWPIAKPLRMEVAVDSF